MTAPDRPMSEQTAREALAAEIATWIEHHADQRSFALHYRTDQWRTILAALRPTEAQARAEVPRLPEIAALREGEWKPIETAPKDGPDLLLYSPWWPALIVGHPATFDAATHWQPLPAPPSTANSEVRS